MMQLDTFHELGEALALNVMDALGRIQESHSQVVENIIDQLVEHDVEYCAVITTRVREAAKQFQNVYVEFKENTSAHMISS